MAASVPLALCYCLHAAFSRRPCHVGGVLRLATASEAYATRHMPLVGFRWARAGGSLLLVVVLRVALHGRALLVQSFKAATPLTCFQDTLTDVIKIHTSVS